MGIQKSSESLSVAAGAGSNGHMAPDAWFEGIRTQHMYLL